MEHYLSPMHICAALGDGHAGAERIEMDVADQAAVRPLRAAFVERAPPQLRERAALVFDELVGNAVEHGGGPVRVDCIYGRRGVAVGTVQRGPFLSEAQVEALFTMPGDPAAFQENGRGGGLVLLRAYADGCYANARNKQLYAVLLDANGRAAHSGNV